MSCQCHRASERGRVGFNTSVSRCNTPPLSNLRKSLLLVAIRYKSILLSFVSAKKFFMGYHKELSLCTPSPSISLSLSLYLSLSLFLTTSRVLSLTLVSRAKANNLNGFHLKMAKARSGFRIRLVQIARPRFPSLSPLGPLGSLSSHIDGHRNWFCKKAMLPFASHQAPLSRVPNCSTAVSISLSLSRGFPLSCYMSLQGLLEIKDTHRPAVLR